MNARAQTYGAFAQALDGLAPENPVELRRRLDDAVAIYDNDWTSERKLALENLLADRPAFWGMYGYSAARCSTFMENCNRGMMHESLAYYGMRYGVQEEKDLLDSLVPLNRKALRMLAEAYAQRGHWRDDEELMRRAVADCRKAVRA